MSSNAYLKALKLLRGGSDKTTRCQELQLGTWEMENGAWDLNLGLGLELEVCVKYIRRESIKHLTLDVGKPPAKVILLVRVLAACTFHYIMPPCTPGPRILEYSDSKIITTLNTVKQMDMYGKNNGENWEAIENKLKSQTTDMISLNADI